MPQLRLYQFFEVVVDGERRKGGSLTAPSRITVSDPMLDAVKSLATATTWDVWTTGSEEPITDFDFLWIESDQNVFLEITTDTGADVGTVVSTVEIKADVPFTLASDTSKANYTADFAAGSNDVIDQLRIRNESGSTAHVRVAMFT